MLITIYKLIYIYNNNYILIKRGGGPPHAFAIRQAIFRTFFSTPFSRNMAIPQFPDLETIKSMSGGNSPASFKQDFYA